MHDGIFEKRKRRQTRSDASPRKKATLRKKMPFERRRYATSGQRL